jgi:cytochrome c biogenesis protein CcdA
MLATINPCAFVMLPSLVSFYLGADKAGYGSRPIVVRLRDGIAFGLATTAGFVAVFSALGLVVSVGAAGVEDIRNLARLSPIVTVWCIILGSGGNGDYRLLPKAAIPLKSEGRTCVPGGPSLPLLVGFPGEA